MACYLWLDIVLKNTNKSKDSFYRGKNFLLSNKAKNNSLYVHNICIIYKRGGRGW